MDALIGSLFDWVALLRRSVLPLAIIIVFVDFPARWLLCRALPFWDVGFYALWPVSVSLIFTTLHSGRWHPFHLDLLWPTACGAARLAVYFALVLGVGVLAGVLLALFLMAGLALITPGIVLEGGGPFAAIRRLRSVFGVTFLVYFLVCWFVSLPLLVLMSTFPYSADLDKILAFVDSVYFLVGGLPTFAVYAIGLRASGHSKRGE